MARLFQRRRLDPDRYSDTRSARPRHALCPRSYRGRLRAPVRSRAAACAAGAPARTRRALPDPRARAWAGIRSAGAAGRQVEADKAVEVSPAAVPAGARELEES